MIQERIKQYIDYKGITPYKFCKNLGFSMGYLDKKGAIGTDKYLKIIEYYKEINPEWLLTGKGSMLKNNEYKTKEDEDTYIVSEDKVKYNVNVNENNYIKLLEENLKEKKEQLENCKKEVENLKKYQVYK